MLLQRFIDAQDLQHCCMQTIVTLYELGEIIYLKHNKW